MINKINISSLSIGYHKKAILKDINISSSSNKLIGLIGRNGKGKSTLLKTISNLLKPISGDIFINNNNVFKISAKEKSKLIGVVLSQPIEINNISVKDFIAYGRYPYTNWIGVETKTDNNAVSKAIELCHLKDFENRNYAELSDGEKQKVNIARVIAQNTPFILLDEPTAHLDLVNKIEILTLLKELSINHNKTIIISTHQIELSLQLCDEIWLLNNHKVTVDMPKNIINNDEFINLFNTNVIHFNKETNSFSINT